MLRNRIVWHFEHGLNASRRFSGRYETILSFTKRDDYVVLSITNEGDHVIDPSMGVGSALFSIPMSR